MPVKKKVAPAPVASDPTNQPEPVKDRALLVNDVTKHHAIALVLDNGVIALVPVTVCDAAHVAENFTEVTE